MAKRKKKITMMAIHPADHPPQDAEQPEDQIPLNSSESNGDSPTFFSAPCSPSHSLSTEEFGTEAVVIDVVVESSQNLNIAGDSFEVRRLNGGAETLPAQVEPCAPQMVQRTKWWNCCGLLEAFHRPCK